MTLTKAIEAAREALTVGDKNLTVYWSETHKRHVYYREIVKVLPDKPMTEDEIAKIIALAVFGECDKYELSLAMEAVIALKGANVLFVEEK